MCFHFFEVLSISNLWGGDAKNERFSNKYCFRSTETNIYTLSLLSIYIYILIYIHIYTHIEREKEREGKREGERDIDR